MLLQITTAFLLQSATKFLKIATGLTNCDNISTNYDRTFRLFPNGRSGMYLAHSTTAAGTDQIPFWVWKEHAETVTPLASPESGFSQFPPSWKRAMIPPPPLQSVPKAHGDYRGIIITPVIARALKSR